MVRCDDCGPMSVKDYREQVCGGSYAEEGGSALSAVKINYADSVHLANSKTRGEEARA